MWAYARPHMGLSARVGWELNNETGRMDVIAAGLSARLPALRGRVGGLSSLASQLWRAGPQGAGHTLLSSSHKSPHKIILTFRGRMSYIICKTQCKMKMWGPLFKIIKNRAVNQAPRAYTGLHACKAGPVSGTWSLRGGNC